MLTLAVFDEKELFGKYHLYVCMWACLCELEVWHKVVDFIVNQIWI